MSSMTSIFNITLSSLGTQAQAIARMQEQASTGSRLIRPSDDPG
ncbi:MAG: flagellar hook-associated protein FlgL, partial [Planctomycetaceae bacterium]